MTNFLETERIQLRRFEKSDFNHLFRLDSDPLVMKFISNGVPANRDRVQEVLNIIIARYDEWQSYGLWAAEVKDNKEFIGWFALKPLPKVEDIEIGYRLLPSSWGQGYATEGSRSLIEYGFQKCNLKKIVAITNPLNLASQNVLLKCGFNQNGKIPDPFSKSECPDEVLFFELLRSAQCIRF